VGRHKILCPPCRSSLKPPPSPDATPRRERGVFGLRSRRSGPNYPLATDRDSARTTYEDSSFFRLSCPVLCCVGDPVLNSRREACAQRDWHSVSHHCAQRAERTDERTMASEGGLTLTVEPPAPSPPLHALPARSSAASASHSDGNGRGEMASPSSQHPLQSPLSPRTEMNASLLKPDDAQPGPSSGSGPPRAPSPTPSPVSPRAQADKKAATCDKVRRRNRKQQCVANWECTVQDPSASKC